MKKFSDRPSGVTIASVFVLCISSWQAIRAYSAIANWDILREFGAATAYILISGLAWAATGFWLAYVLWTGRPLAFAAGLALAGLYLAWYWLDRLMVQPSPAPNLVWSIAISVLLLTIFTSSMLLSKNYFEMDGRYSMLTGRQFDQSSKE